jgi:hypothetical protein
LREKYIIVKQKEESRYYTVGRSSFWQAIIGIIKPDICVGNIGKKQLYRPAQPGDIETARRMGGVATS